MKICKLNKNHFDEIVNLYLIYETGHKIGFYICWGLLLF